MIMNYKKHGLLLLAALLLFSFAVAAQTNNLAPAGSVKKELAIERLKKNVPELMKEANIPGLSLALIRDGKLAWSQGFGVKNSETKESVTNDTIFEAASLSKPVVAYAVLKLVDAGKLDLDVPLNKYLPGNYDAGDDARINQITARNVLSHTSGFPNWRQPRDAKTLPIFFTPGERFSYSGEGFVYLAKVVEHVTKMKLEEFIRRTVFEPLGMTASSFEWQERYKNLKGFNHDIIGNPTGRNEPKEANAAGSLHTTAADYARFVIAVLKGDGLKKRTRDLMLSPQIRVDKNCLNCTNRPNISEISTEIGWGLGWGLQTTGEGTSFWHWGDNGNNKSFIVAFDKQKSGAVILTNSANGLSIIKEILADGVGGKYPALAWINYESFEAPGRVLLKAILNEGAEKALRDYRQRREKTAEIKLNESQMNSLGYDLLRSKKVDEAIAVFRLNTEDFPKSANVWDSLGEAYMVKGDKPKSIENYKKALELNPGNKNLIERIKQLEQ
jgi:CubicO group peptidase (beta-lactamase class C family)